MGARRRTTGRAADEPDQPGLFGLPPEEAPPPPRAEDDWSAALSATHRAAATVAARLPPGVRFGTSSWSFPGWRGLVYGASRTQASLAREGLREYARHPLLRTVGVDRTYYAPVAVEDLRRYADQVPADFPCCLKAPASVTAAFVGQSRGEPPVRNADFLSAERLSRELLEPVAQAFRRHAGPFVIECAPLPRGAAFDPAAFAERLDALLGALPREFRYGVELRTPAWLTPAYARVLARHDAAHVYNYWSAMPMPGAQATTVPPAQLPFVVVRLLLRPGTWYEDQRSRFAPFDRLVEPDEGMRGQVTDLLAGAVARAAPAYVLVNNKAEGSAPLTIAALAEQLAGQLPRRGPGAQSPA